MSEELKPCRYRVEKTGYGLWPYCVRAGDGTRELFRGHKKQCMVVAAELETAFEDGKFVSACNKLPIQGGEAVAIVCGSQVQWLPGAGKMPDRSPLYTHQADQVAEGVRLDGLVRANQQLGRIYLHFKTTEQQHIALRELRALLAKPCSR